MIVSHKHKFIFLKTRKTAGTSIEIVLEKLCGDVDIVTRVSANYADEVVSNHRERNSKGLKGHVPASLVRKIVGEDTWHTYFKFTVERNPWDKFVSMFWWRKFRYGIKEDFADFCFKSLEEDSKIYTCPCDYHIYTLNGEVVVDSIIRFENLQADFTNIMAELDLPFVGIMPRAKSKIRKNKHLHYTEYYTDELRDAVAGRFNREIDLLNYEFKRHFV